jgi:tetratricopeptide (TPR) repeat protein
LRPGDAEAQELLTHLKGGATAVASSFGAPPASSALAVTDPEAPAAGPLERIERGFNDAAFRQAAFAMEQIESMRLDAMPPAQHAAALTREGQQYLAEGLILEAERQFQAALALDGNNAAAYAGLADVRTRSGDETAARREAEASIQLKPNAAAYIVLARLDLAASQLRAAAADIQQAIALEPANAVAKNLQQTIQDRASSAQKAQRMP